MFINHWLIFSELSSWPFEGGEEEPGGHWGPADRVHRHHGERFYLPMSLDNNFGSLFGAIRIFLVQ